MIRVAVVARREVVRRGIAAALSAGEIAVIGEANDLEEGRDLCTSDEFDVVVVDASAFGHSEVAGSPAEDAGRYDDIAGELAGDGGRPDAQGPVSRGIDQVAMLTQRERQVLQLIGAGLSNRAIASRLTLAERTVKTHVGRILAKLKVESRLQAGLVAMVYQMTVHDNDRQRPARWP